MLEGTIKWLDANSRKVTKHVRTGESLDLTNPAPLSCANLSFKSHKKTVFFSGLTVQENSLSFSIINAFYIIHVPDGCSFTLELITPVPVLLPNEFNPQLESPDSKCCVYFFLLSNGNHLCSIQTKWKNIPQYAPMHPEFKKLPLKVSKFRCLIGEMELSEPLSLGDIFSDPNLFQRIGRNSLVLYVHHIDASRFVTTEGLPQICRDVVARALEKDPLLKNRNVRRVATIAMSGGLALDKLSAVGMNSAAFTPEVLNWDKAFAPEGGVNAVLAKYTTIQQEFVDQNALKSVSEISLCFKSWYEIIRCGVRGSTFKYDLEWSPTASFDLDDTRNVDFGLFTSIFESNLHPLLLVESALEESPPPSEHKDFAKLETVASLTCRKLAFELMKKGKNPLLAKCFGMLIGGRGAQIFVASAKAVEVNNIGQIHVEISKEDSWYIDLEDGPFFNGVPESFKEFKDFPRNPAYVPSLNVRSLLALDWFFKQIGAVEECIRKAPSNSNPNLPDPSDFFAIGSFDPAVIPCATTGTDKETPHKYRLTYIDRPPQLNLRMPVPVQDLSVFFEKWYYPYEAYFTNKLSESHPFPFRRLLSIKKISSSKVEYQFESMYPAIHPQVTWFECINSEVFKLSGKDCDLRFVQDAFEMLLGASVGLFTLHEQCALVHTDVWPGNIMYSWHHQCWKLVNFETILTIEYSRENPHFRGSRGGYCAPEALDSLIYTPACDVYSLGRTIDCIFCRNFKHLDFSSAELEKCAQLVRQLAAALASFKAEDRPSLVFCINLALNALSWPCFKILEGSERMIQYAKELIGEEQLEVKGLDDYLSLLEKTCDSNESKAKVFIEVQEQPVACTSPEIETATIEADAGDAEELKTRLAAFDLEETTNSDALI